MTATVHLPGQALGSASRAPLVRVAAVTLPSRAPGSVPTLAANVASAVAAVRALSPAHPDLICLPESFLYDGLADRRPGRLAVDVEGELIERFADLAHEAGALLAVPFLEAAEGDRVHNSVVLLDEAGRRVGVYRKQLLWPSDRHLGTLEGGVTPGQGGGPFGPLAVRICLEMQYPTAWEDLRAQFVKLVLFPSEQAGGAALAARAWQARSYVLSAVSKGGRSAVIDPVGHVVAGWAHGHDSPWVDLSLDHVLVHLDAGEDRFRQLAPQLRGRVRFTRYEDERVCLVSSLDPALAVHDLLSQERIPTLDEYLTSVGEQNRVRAATSTSSAPRVDPGSADPRPAVHSSARSAQRGPSEVPGPRAVSVVVPTRGDSPALRRTLAALSGQQGCELPVEIVVVLNGEQTRMADPPDGVRVVHEPTRGPAAARNTGIRESSGDVLALVDDDCEPSPQWLAAAVAALRRAGPDVILAGAITRSGAERNLVSRFDSLSYLRQESYVRYSQAFVTANVIVPRSVFDRVGGFDESFPEAAGEDWDWAKRATALGVRIVYDESAAIDHPCMTDARALRAKAERLGRGEARLRRKYDPHAADVGLVSEIRRQVRRSRGHDDLALEERLRLQGLGVLVGYWMWQGRRAPDSSGGRS